MESPKPKMVVRRYASYCACGNGKIRQAKVCRSCEEKFKAIPVSKYQKRVVKIPINRALRYQRKKPRFSPIQELERKIKLSKQNISRWEGMIGSYKKMRKKEE